MIFRHRTKPFTVSAKIACGRVFVERRCWVCQGNRRRRFIMHFHTQTRRWSMPEVAFRRLYRTLAGHPIKKIPPC